MRENLAVSKTDVEVNIKGLEQLLKAVTKPLPSIKVGILGASPRTPEKPEVKQKSVSLKRASFTDIAANIGNVTARGRLKTKKKSLLTNATVGAAHEFGTTKLPQRSFLRVPLTENLQGALETSGAFDKTALNEVVRTGSLDPWIKKAGVVAESVVLGAFDTGGYGKWPPSDMTKKENHQTLVETQQLRNAITHEVK